MERIDSLRQTLRGEEVGSIARRFLINTLFDATFVLLGIVVGSIFAPTHNLRLLVTTMVGSSFALGISTGVSVYEAESLEQELKISRLEKALFRDLSGTQIERQARSVIFLVSTLNFFTPLFSCAVTVTPFLLAIGGFLQFNLAGWVSIILALSVLFGAGVYMGRLGKTNPWKKGLRMVLFGMIAFLVGYALNVLL